MNDRRTMYAYPDEGIRPGEIFNCSPAAIYGDMQCESQVMPNWARAGYASSEASRNSSQLFKLLEEIIEQNLPRVDADAYRQFVDFRSVEPISRRRAYDTRIADWAREQCAPPKEPAELTAGDTSQLDDFLGGFVKQEV